MIGLVVVSHSPALAEAACEFALLMAPEEQPRIEIAAGSPTLSFGTSARRIVDAINAAATPDGVLVLVDLGSAVINAAIALDLLGETTYPVKVSEAAFVEGLSAAIATAAAGATLDEVDTEARRASSTKGEPLASRRDAWSAWSGWNDESSLATTCRLSTNHGLHARPAASVVDALLALDADVRIRNVSTAGGFVPASSISELMTLGAAAGDILAIEARGPDAPDALHVVRSIVSIEPRDAEDQRTARSIGISPGVGVGIGCTAATGSSKWTDSDYVAASPEKELERLRAAREAAAIDLAGLQASTRTRVGPDAAGIFDSWQALLNDPALLDPIERDIGSGTPALRAWLERLADLTDRLRQLSDPYQRQRIADIGDICDRVAAHLTGRTKPAQTLDGILLVDEICATDVAELDPDRCRGIVAARGSATSHAAILARCLGIPVVVGASTRDLDSFRGKLILIDADADIVIANPTPEQISYAERRDKDDKPPILTHMVTTRDGNEVNVGANISLVSQAGEALRMGADSIALLRSEFLFASYREAPSVDQHFAAYRAVAEQLNGRPVTIRTFDSAADKPVWFLGGGLNGGPEGLALTLAHPDVLVDQIRAVLRVAADHPTRLLFPHVVDAGDLNEAVELVERARTLEQAADFDSGRVDIGAMIESPVAVLDLEAISIAADFLAVGTNDFTAHTAGRLRTDAGPAHSSTIDPAVLRLVALAGAVPPRGGLSVCGELANDPDAIPLLIGLGVATLGVHPANVPNAKREVQRWTLRDARELAETALRCRTGDEIRRLATDARDTLTTTGKGRT